MNLKFSIILAMSLALTFPAISLYAWKSGGNWMTDRDNATKVAITFLKNAPTFKFDGISNSMNVVETRILESYPIQYVVAITFESRHSGYGDRTGQFLAQVITEHAAEVKVVDSMVVSAILDGRWDELNQRNIKQGDEEANNTLISPELAREKAIDYVFRIHNIKGVVTTSSWTELSLTPRNWVGLNKVRYTGDGWNVTISNAVVLRPLYNIEIGYSAEFSFQWRGTVGPDGEIVETEFTVVK